MMADTRVKKTMGTGMGVSKRRAADPRNGLDELQAQRLMLPGLAACAACAACYDAHDGAGAIKAQGLRAHPSAPSSPAAAAPPPAFAAAGSIQLAPSSQRAALYVQCETHQPCARCRQQATSHCKVLHATARLSVESLHTLSPPIPLLSLRYDNPTSLPALRQSHRRRRCRHAPCVTPCSSTCCSPPDQNRRRSPSLA